MTSLTGYAHVREAVAYSTHAYHKRRKVADLDTTQNLCSETVCFAGKDGTSLYWDDNHISVAGVEMILSSLRLR